MEDMRICQWMKSDVDVKWSGLKRGAGGSREVYSVGHGSCTHHSCCPFILRSHIIHPAALHSPNPR